MGSRWWPWTASGASLYPRMTAGWAEPLYSCIISCVLLCSAPRGSSHLGQLVCSKLFNNIPSDPSQLPSSCQLLEVFSMDLEISRKSVWFCPGCFKVVVWLTHHHAFRNLGKQVTRTDDKNLAPHALSKNSNAVNPSLQKSVQKHILIWKIQKDTRLTLCWL